MKKIQLIIAFSSLIIISACNCDEEVAKGYFPTSIELTNYTSSVNNKSITISYNLNNTISQITLEDNDGVKTKQYAYTNGRITSVTNTGFLGGPATRTFVYNSSGILSSIVEETGGSVETYPITYNAVTNRYTLMDGTDAVSVELDASGNPIINSSTSFTSDLVLTLDPTEKGVFRNVSPQIALQFDIALFNNGHIFYFFNQKQINHFEFGVQDIDVINNRDTNGNISSVVYNFMGGGSQIDITYQIRNL